MIPTIGLLFLFNICSPVDAKPKPLNRIYLIRLGTFNLFSPTTRGELISLDVATGQVRVHSPEPFETDSRSGFAVSPDGTQAAYTEAVIEGNTMSWGLYSASLTNLKQKPRRLPVHGDIVTWTHDSASIVISEDVTWAKAHHLVDDKTLKVTNIPLPQTDKPNHPQGRWGHVILDASPDGKHWLTKTIAGDARESPTGLYLVNRNTVASHQIVGANDATSACISPDGKTILFQTDGPSDAKLFTIPLDGGTPHQLSGTEHPTLQPSFCWSPDSKQIAYVARQGNTANEMGELVLMLRRVDGTEPKVLLRSKNLIEEGFQTPRWR